MAGETYVTTVEQGLNTMVLSARAQREFPTDVMPRLVDRQSLPSGSGISFREFTANKLTAQNYGEEDDINNPQALSGSILSYTPSLVAIQTFIGDRVQERLSPKAYATFGQLAQNAMDRKMDQDGIALFASATTTMSGTGTTLASGIVSAAARRITSNATEPGPNPIACVLHGYQIQDLQAEVTAGIGTYPVPVGYTQEVYKNGFAGMINSANVYEDGNITLTATPDARGAVFSKMAILLVQGRPPWKEQRREPSKGYGGWNVWIKNEYVYGERSVGNWLYGILSDATAPTS